MHKISKLSMCINPGYVVCNEAFKIHLPFLFLALAVLKILSQ